MKQTRHIFFCKIIQCIKRPQKDGYILCGALPSNAVCGKAIGGNTMNCCFSGNRCLWVLVILLILGTCGNVFSSSAFKGCGWPILAALAYCMCKNGTLQSVLANVCG